MNSHRFNRGSKAFGSALLVSVSLLSAHSLASPVTAVIRLQERVAMEDLAENVKSPTSLMTRAYTSEEIRAISAPSDQEYNDLVAKLQQEGFKVTSESPTHLWLSLQADSSVFERVFSTQIHSSLGFRRALVEPQVPNRLSLIASISGLNNDRHSHPMFIKGKKGKGDQPTGITRSQITSFYGIDSLYKKGLSGKGQHIAIATYMGLNLNDVKQFYKLMALSPMPTVDQVQFNGVPAYDSNSATETELDAEFSGMIAPGAAVHVFASATNDDAGELQMFTAILDDGHAADMAKVFARAAAQGVNIMVASGDSGSDSCQNSTTVADWPAANPNVVAVGGTTLLSGSGSSFTEQGWSGSGGGISALWDSPDYQHKLGAPYVKRSYPDVSFNADPLSGEAIYVSDNGQNPSWLSIGGTSMAAPQWSGLMALVGEARAKAGKKPLGFLNPIIYGLSAAQYATAFNDTLEGNNGAYDAGKGWDAVTGLGSPKAAGLLTILMQ